MPYDKVNHKYTPPKFEYYVLTRDDNYMVNPVIAHSPDPVFPYETWELFDGPFDTQEAAFESIIKDFTC